MNLDCNLQTAEAVEPRYHMVVGVHDFGPRCTRVTLGVPMSATRELLNSNRRPLHQVQERCRNHLYANTQFIELIKTSQLASTCIILKCKPLLNLEMNNIHVCIPLWNKSDTMMYWTNRPTNRK